MWCAAIACKIGQKGVHFFILFRSTVQSYCSGRDFITFLCVCSGERKAFPVPYMKYWKLQETYWSKHHSSGKLMVIFL